MFLQIETVQILTALVFMQQSKYLYLSNFFTAKRGLSNSIINRFFSFFNSALILIDLLAWALTFAIYFFSFSLEISFFFLAKPVKCSWQETLSIYLLLNAVTASTFTTPTSMQFIEWTQYFDEGITFSSYNAMDNILELNR